MNKRNETLVRQKYREYLIPLLLTSFAFSAASLIQNMIIGRFLQENALSAVGMAAPAVQFIDMIYMIFSVGGVTCATISLGKLENRNADLIFTLTIAGGIAAMLLFSISANAFLSPISVMLSDGNAEISRLTSLYLRPLLIAAPLEMFACSIAAFISSDGNPRYTCAVIIVSNLVQILLCYVFIHHLNIGLRSVGLSSLIGNAIGSIMVLPYLNKKRSSYHLVLPKLRDFRFVLPILKTGFNSGWMTACEILSSSALIMIILSCVGANGLSFMVVCMNIKLVIDIVIGGMTDTLLPMTGSLYGEQDFFGIRQLVKLSLKTLLLGSALIASLFILLPGYAGRLFGIESQEILRQLTPAVRMYAVSLPFYALSTFLQHYYNIIGYQKLSALLSLLKNLLLQIPFALLLSRISHESIWLCFFLAEAVALLTVYLLSRKFIMNREIRGILLLPVKNKNEDRLEFTSVASIHEAGELTRRILAFGKDASMDKKLINHVAVAVEEMLIATAHFAHKDSGTGLVDVMIYVTAQQISVRFRDNGTPFNPLEYTPPENSPCITDGVELIKKMATHLHYSRKLGFNTTMMTFSLYSE